MLDIVMTPEEVMAAKERGRRMAAEAIRCNPDSRRRVESLYGTDFCMRRYPEAYAKVRGGIMRTLGRVIPFTLCLLILFTGLAQAQDVVQPRISCVSGTCATLYTKNTAGTVLSGGHAAAITASTTPHLLMTAAQTSCIAPTFAACNFIYVPNSGGAMLVTQTLATAAAPGNVLLAMVETDGTAITRIAYPNQSGSVYTQALGPLAAFATDPVPSAAAGQTLGTALLPFGSAYLGTAATNNIRFHPLAVGAARAFRFADPGATGAFAFADPAVTTRQLIFGLAGATGISTVESTLLNGRTITLVDPGGAAATLAYINPTTAQGLANNTYFGSATAAVPATVGAVRLGNTEAVNWRNAVGGANIGLSVSAANLLIWDGTQPTDGYYFVPPTSCSMQLSVGTFAANPATSGALSAPSMVRAAAGNTVLQLTTTAAANTTIVTCDFTPPSRLLAGAGIVINNIEVLFGYQTTALTSIGTLTPTSVTYPAPGGAAAGTVAAAGGILTVTPGTDHATPGAVTTTGQMYNELIAFGTPVQVVTDRTRYTWANSFVQTAAAATILQIGGTIVHYTTAR
jgi:hypothetical protein